MALNLDAFTAHVDITISLSSAIVRDATFLETVCFHLVDNNMSIASMTSNVFTPYGSDIIFDDADALSDDTWEEIDRIASDFLNGGGKSAMFLITSPSLVPNITDVRDVQSKALSIASGEDISTLATQDLFSQNVLLFPTSDKAYVNTLLQSYVFYIEDATAGLSGDFLNFLTMLFSKTGDAFFDRKIMFNIATLVVPTNALVYKEDILALHSQKLSSYEMLNTPNTARVSNFATLTDNGMGIYQRYRIKVACEQALDELITRYDFKYNARSMREGVSGMIGGMPNCLVRIYGTLHRILNDFVSRGILQTKYLINIPDQTLEDYKQELITGITTYFSPYKSPFRIEATFRDSSEIDNLITGANTINGVSSTQQAVFYKGKIKTNPQNTLRGM